MTKNTKNKKMATFGLVLVLIGGIFVAIGGFIWNRFSSKSNAEKHIEVIEQGKHLKEDVRDVKDKVTKGVDELKKQMTLNEQILISPLEVIVPAKASREIPIVITNNYPYPVFMVVVEMTVLEGDIDLTSDLLVTPPSNGIQQSKYFSHQVNQINSRATENLIAKINCFKNKNPSKIKLTIAAYMKEPMPDFTTDGNKTLPETLKIPDGFVPKIYKLDSNQKDD